jgi:hypothetical protein
MLLSGALDNFGDAVTYALGFIATIAVWLFDTG